MTIRLINAPRMGSSFAPVFTCVKEVTKFDVVFHDGSRVPVSCTAKCELLSVLDADGTYEDDKEFFRSLGIELNKSYMRIGHGGIEEWRNWHPEFEIVR